MCDEIYVLDTSAILYGVNVGELSGKVVMSRKASNEVISKREILDFYVSVGKIEVIDPCEAHVKRILEVAKATGDLPYLTEADVDTLALALRYLEEGKKVTLISDDFSVQNVARKVGIPYKPIATQGIKYEISWVVYCPGCKAVYVKAGKIGVCPRCGHVLSRKAIKKLKLRS